MSATGVIGILLVIAWQLWLGYRRQRVGKALRERHPGAWLDMGRPGWFRSGRLDFGPDATGAELDFLADEDLSRAYKANLRRTGQTRETALVAFVLIWVAAMVAGALLMLRD